MTPEQIDLVQSSFAEAFPQAEAVVTLFYDRLFALDPSLNPLFKGDIKEQRDKFIAMLQIAVHDLERVEETLPALRQMGQRHADYGVRAEHYNTVGVALLWTLEQTLGETFTPEVESAWRAVYSLLATTMQTGVASQSPMSAHG